MDFLKIIKKSLAFIKKHRYQWGLGILASLGGGTMGMRNGLPSGFDNPRDQELAERTGQWVSAHASTIAVGAVIGILIGILFIYLSLRAQAGLIKSADRIEKNEAYKSFSAAWKAGQGYAGRLFILGLLVTAIVIGWLIIFFGIPALLMILVQNLGIYIFGGLLVFAGIIGLLIIIFGIRPVVEYANREIVLRNHSTIDAFMEALRKIKVNLANTILALVIEWLIATVVMIAIIIVVGLIGGLLGLIGWGVYSGLGVISTIIYSVLLGIPFLALMAILAGIVQAFYSNYWTLIYLELKK